MLIRLKEGAQIERAPAAKRSRVAVSALGLVLALVALRDPNLAAALVLLAAPARPALVLERTELRAAS